ncbi:MAG: GGDEF domain-containing protein, partial [Kineosporiaceae bacterium]
MSTDRAIRTAASVWLSTLIGIGVAGAVVTAGLGLRGSSAVTWAAPTFSAIVAVLSTGTVLLLRGRRHTATGLSAGIAAAMVVWAAGQVLTALTVRSGDSAFPLIGDLLTFPALPLATLALLAVPSRHRQRDTALRLGVDATALGFASALLMWWFAYRPRADGPASAQGALVAVVAVAAITLAYLALLTAIRDLDIALIGVAAGIGLLSLGTLLTMYQVLGTGHQRGWLGAALLCLAWPPIAAGALNHRGPGEDDDLLVPAVDPDARVVAVTTTASLVLLSVGLVAILVMGARKVDSVSLLLVLSSVITFWLRELLNARQRADLLRRVYDEATADPLTGLANRRVLTARLAALPPYEAWSLLVVDLDGFKDFNDLFGHPAGDRLLRATAHRLRSAAPPGATVSRLGGDEFAVLAPGERSQGMQIGHRLVAAVRLCAGDMQLSTRIPVSASVGVAELRGGRPTVPAGVNRTVPDPARAGGTGGRVGFKGVGNAGDTGSPGGAGDARSTG